jgi:hypothetical protein
MRWCTFAQRRRGFVVVARGPRRREVDEEQRDRERDEHGGGEREDPLPPEGGGRADREQRGRDEVADPGDQVLAPEQAVEPVVGELGEGGLQWPQHHVARATEGERSDREHRERGRCGERQERDGDGEGAPHGERAPVAVVGEGGDGAADEPPEGEQREEPAGLAVRQAEVPDLVVDGAGGEVRPPLVEQAHDERAADDADAGGEQGARRDGHASRR